MICDACQILISNPSEGLDFEDHVIDEITEEGDVFQSSSMNLKKDENIDELDPSFQAILEVEDNKTVLFDDDYDIKEEEKEEDDEVESDFKHFNLKDEELNIKTEEE